MKKTIVKSALVLCALYNHAFSEETTALYIEAAEQGNAEAQYNLGKIYLDGDNIEKDATKAVEWFKKSAEQGNLKAQNSLSVFYLRGEVVEKDIVKAFNMMRNATRYGERVPQGIREAIASFKEAAARGDAEAQYSLGMCHIYGTYSTPTGLWPWNEASGGSFPDTKKAVELFLKSAEQGHAAAQYQLSTYYNNGHGVKQDLEKAFEWLQKSAEQEYAPAQLVLAHRYLINGEEVKAVKIIKKLALLPNSDTFTKPF